MSRERTQVGDLQRQIASPQASPTDTFTTPGFANQITGTSGAAQLSEALGLLQPALQKGMDYAAQVESKRGELQAKADIIDPKIDPQTWFNDPRYTDSSPAYQASYSKLAGAKQAQDILTERQAAYEGLTDSEKKTLDPKFFNKTFPENLSQGDTFYKAGFSDTYLQGLQSLQQQHAVDASRLKKVEFIDNLKGSVDKDIQYLFSSGASPEEIQDHLGSYGATAKQLGVPQSVLEDQVFLTLSQKYSEEGDIAAVTAIANIKGSDGIKFKDRTSKAGMEANKILNLTQKTWNENNGLVIAEAKSNLVIEAAKGNFNKTDAQKLLDIGALSPDGYASILTTSIKEAEKVQAEDVFKNQVGALADQGLLYAVPQGKEKAVKEVIDDKLALLAKKDEAAGNEQSTIDFLRRNGIAHPVWKSAMKAGVLALDSGDILNGKISPALEAGLDRWGVVSETSKSTLSEYLNPSEIAFYDQYSALRRANYSKVDALQFIKNLKDNPDKDTPRAKLKTAEVEKGSKEIFKDQIPFFSVGRSITNDLNMGVSRDVFVIADGLAQTGVEPKEAVRLAQERLMPTYVASGPALIKKSLLVNNQEDMDGIRDLFLDHFLKSHEQSASKNEIALVPVNTEGTLWAFQTTGDKSYLKDKSGKVRTYNKEDLLNGYKASKVTKAITEQITDTSKSLEGAANTAAMPGLNKDVFKDTVLSNGLTVTQNEKRLAKLREELSKLTKPK